MHYDGFISGGGDNAYRGNVRSTITPIRKQIPRPRSGLAEIENYTAFGYRCRPVQTEQPQIRIPSMGSFIHGLLNATASFSEAFGPQHRNKAWQAKSRIPLLHQVTGWR